MLTKRNPDTLKALMEYRMLGRSGLKVSSIGLGTATFGREIDKETSFAVADRAFERGITLIDTAEAYSSGLSETILGNWIASRRARDHIVVATKVTGTLNRKRIILSAEASLRRLQIETIDLFQLHVWDSDTPINETLQALDVLVTTGKARAIGCSTAAAWQVCKALWHQEAGGWALMCSVQPVYSLAKREIEIELLPLCKDQNVGVITYSPLGAGFLTGKYFKGGPVPSGSRFDVVPGHQDIYFNDSAYLAMERLRTISASMGRPMADLGLAWVLSRDGVTSTLIGARSPAQIDQAFDADGLSQLPAMKLSIANLALAI